MLPEICHIGNEAKLSFMLDKLIYLRNDLIENKFTIYSSASVTKYLSYSKNTSLKTSAIGN